MNRSAHIARRTPLRASTPLPRTSAKRHAARPARQACRTEVLARNDGRCVRCNVRPASEVHEVKRRSQGGDPTDAAGCVGLCGPSDGRGPGCHQFVTEHPEQGHAEGFVVWSWESVGEFVWEDGSRVRNLSALSDHEKRRQPPDDSLVRRARCTKCGEAIVDRRNFCPNCGHALRTLHSVGVDRTSLR